MEKTFITELIKTKKENLIIEIEKILIKNILKKTSGNKVQAAKLLGINRHTLSNKMKKYNIINVSNNY